MRKLTINETKLTYIREYLVEHVYRNGDIMYNEEIINSDLLDIVCDLYEYLHVLITGESYDYFFHWANKLGCWQETGYFDYTIRKIMENDMKEKELTP